VVESRHGSSPAWVEVNDSIRSGVVSIPHGWGAPNVNQLTSDSEELDPLTGMPRFSGFPVTVTAV
jgi:formylmethanofuran dehydrogenase subunit D